MIYSLEGKIVKKIDKKSESERGQYLALALQGGIAFKVGVPRRTFEKARTGENLYLFTSLNPRENAMDIYGFSTEEELAMFELLNGVSGIGPKSALSILSVAEVDVLKAAVLSGKINLLTRASGIGPKIASRIILELKNKIKISESVSQKVGHLESDLDLIEILAEIGYSRVQAKEAVSKLPEDISEFEKRLKEALKILGKR